MLDLASTRWGELTHAYGAAADIPALLQQLEADPRGPHTDYRDEPWFSLWSSLCHQGDVSTASYAAVPHLLRIAATVSDLPTTNYFLLPTCIEIARLTNRGPAIPHDLAAAYQQALQQLHTLACQHAAAAWDEELSRTIAAALVVTKGHAKLAEVILELSPEAIAAFRASQGMDE